MANNPNLDDELELPDIEESESDEEDIEESESDEEDMCDDEEDVPPTHINGNNCNFDGNNRLGLLQLLNGNNRLGLLQFLTDLATVIPSSAVRSVCRFAGERSFFREAY
jgi:hypothetical protein